MQNHYFQMLVTSTPSSVFSSVAAFIEMTSGRVCSSLVSRAIDNVFVRLLDTENCYSAADAGQCEDSTDNSILEFLPLG